MRIEKLHLDRAITASSAPKLTGLSSLDGKMSAGMGNSCGLYQQAGPCWPRLGTDGDRRRPHSRAGTTITVVPQYGKPDSGSGTPKSKLRRAAAAGPPGEVEAPPLWPRGEPRTEAVSGRRASRGRRPCGERRGRHPGGERAEDGIRSASEPRTASGRRASRGRPRCEIQSNLLKL